MTKKKEQCCGSCSNLLCEGLLGKGILYRVQYEKPFLKGKFTFGNIEKAFK